MRVEETTVTDADMECPLVVDVDGTLIKTDLLAESFLALMASEPMDALRSVAVLRNGRAALKRSLAEQTLLDIENIPLNEELVAFLRAQREGGRRIYLASAADRRYVEALAQRLDLFDGIFASDGAVNLKGAHKAEALCAAFGEGRFDYVGNDDADLAIWRVARKVYVTGGSAGLVRRVRREFPEATIFPREGGRLAEAFRALRPHQWLKNLLVLVPAFTAHQFDSATLIRCLLAFVSFSLCASSVYVLNDLLDLKSDRDHPVKRRRPFAAGRLSLFHGVALGGPALAIALGLALLLPAKFLLVLALYYAMTLAYSTYLKRKATLDVMVLACLYGMRLLAGASAAIVPLSPWLLTFAIFIFLSLALVKRWAELRDRQAQGRGDPPRRGYRLTDLPMLQTMATASGYVAVMICGLYVNSPVVTELYRHPNRLWAIPVVLLYWISRILMLTHRGEMHDDPVLFAAKERTSLACLALMVAAVLAGL